MTEESQIPVAPPRESLLLAGCAVVCSTVYLYCPLMLHMGWLTPSWLLTAFALLSAPLGQGLGVATLVRTPKGGAGKAVRRLAWVAIVVGLPGTLWLCLSVVVLAEWMSHAC